LIIRSYFPIGISFADVTENLSRILPISSSVTLFVLANCLQQRFAIAQNRLTCGSVITLIGWEVLEIPLAPASICSFSLA